MNEKDAKAIRSEYMSLDKRFKNLAMEIQTIDVLTAHMLSDLRGEHVSVVKVNVARYLCETIQRITETYR
jgi:hypothetical protein